MTTEDNRKRSRWLQYPASTEGPREYEIVRRLKQEGKADILGEKVETSQKEILEMAHVVDAAGGDAARFLELLRQDAEAFGVLPADVYSGDLAQNDKWADTLTLNEVTELRELSHTGYEYVTEQDQDLQVADPDSVIQRLGELYEFLDVAADIELAPSLYQG